MREFFGIEHPARQELFAFAMDFKEPIQDILEQHRLNLIAKNPPNAPFYFDINNPACVPGCNLVAYAPVIERAYQKFHIEPLVGNVVVYGPRTEDTFSLPHIALRSTVHTDFTLDFTVGQFAYYGGTTLEQWMKQYPELFVRENGVVLPILLAQRGEVGKKMGVHYPKQNSTFQQVFG